MNFKERVDEDIKRFLQMLKLHPGADLHMILLRGHLLIEEALQSFIEQMVPNKAPLVRARLSFSQRLAVAEALHPDRDLFGLGWIWSSIKALNGIRNMMVHSIAPAKFDHELDAFMLAIEQRLPLPTKPGQGPEYRKAKCGMMLSFMNAYLASLLQGGVQLTGQREPQATLEQEHDGLNNRT